MKEYAFIIEHHPAAGNKSGMDVCLTAEQMRIFLLAAAGFPLRTEERETIREPYIQLMRELKECK